MTDDLRMHFDLDTSIAHDKLSEVEAARQEAISAINGVISMARTAYITVTNVVKAGGGTIDAFFSFVISTGLSAVSIISSIATALTATPGGQLQAGIIWAQVAVSVASLVTATANQVVASGEMQSATMALHGISNLLSGLKRFGG